MSNNRHIKFGPIDPLNPGFGYHIRVEHGGTGEVLLSTAKHPVTGRDIDFSDCLEIAGWYAIPLHSESRGEITWRPGTITLAGKNGFLEESTFEVVGMVSSDGIWGLNNRDSADDTEGGWIITHLKTGFMISKARFEIVDAMKICEILSQDPDDWAFGCVGSGSKGLSAETKALLAGRVKDAVKEVLP